jgi:hypothetical protein
MVDPRIPVVKNPFSDSTVGNRAVTKNKTGSSPAKKPFSDQQKLDLLKMYTLTGNLALSAASLRIPEKTARRWKASNWWKERMADLKSQKDFEVSARLEKIIQSSLEIMEDRLTRGDYFFNGKTGKIERKPVSLQAAHKVAVDLMDRQDVLEQRALKGETQEVAVDKWIALAEKFASLASQSQEKPKPTVEVTDVIYVNESEQEEKEQDALHDERQEGCEEAVSEVRQQTLSDEEESPEEQGEETGECLWTYTQG